MPQLQLWFIGVAVDVQAGMSNYNSGNAVDVTTYPGHKPNAGVVYICIVSKRGP